MQPAQHRLAGQEVYTAASWTEYERLQQEGAVFEGLVVDPVYRLAQEIQTDGV